VKRFMPENALWRRSQESRETRALSRQGAHWRSMRGAERAGLVRELAERLLAGHGLNQPGSTNVREQENRSLIAVASGWPGE
jgi:hypothetical protein